MKLCLNDILNACVLERRGKVALILGGINSVLVLKKKTLVAAPV